MKRLLGIDLGKARVGLAISDELGLLAHPLETLREDALEACPLPIDHVRHVASLAQAALLKKLGESDVCDFFAELDFRHWSRFRR